MARIAPTISADQAREMLARSRIARMSAPTKANPPRYATNPPVATEIKFVVRREIFSVISVRAS